MNESLLERVCGCPALPALPMVAAEVLRLASAPDAHLSRIASTLNQDATLAARVLKTVNSSAFGQRRRITSIPQAIGILGQRQLKNLVVGLTLIPALGKSKTGTFDQLAHCRRSLYSANAAKIFSTRIKTSDPDELFLGGLLMDLGVIALATALGDEYSRVLLKAPKHADLESVERQMLSLTHSRISAALVERWNLPSELAEPIRCHHTPQKSSHSVRSGAMLLYVSGLCADVYVEEDPLWAIAEIERVCREELQLTNCDANEVLSELAESTRSLGESFQIQIDPMATFARVQSRAVGELASSSKSIRILARPATELKPRSPSIDRSETRRQDRQPANGFIEIRPFSDTMVGELERVECSDISPSGIGLRLPRPVSMGSQFIVALRRGANSAIILYTVRHVRRIEPERYEVGCEATTILRQRDFREGTASDVPKTPLHSVARTLLSATL